MKCQGFVREYFWSKLIHMYTRGQKLKNTVRFSKYCFSYETIISKYRIHVTYRMQQSVCLVLSKIMVDSYPAFFSCTLVRRASHSMMAPAAYCIYESSFFIQHDGYHDLCVFP